jgi:glycosyltransferase involved in cell wall biosynthesis
VSQRSQPQAGGAGRTADFVSIIVPIYNGEDGVDHLLAALAAQDYPADRFEIVIVDNGSRDRTMELVEAFARASPALSVRLVKEHDHRGSYAARNKGVSTAKGPILAFTDADCRPVPGWLSAGVGALRRHGVEQVAGAIEFLFANDQPNAWERVDSVVHLRQDLYVRDNGFGATANLFVLADALAKAGGFRQNLQSGGDFEFGQRMKAAGFRIAYSPEALIRHSARASHDEIATKVRRVAAGLNTLAGEGLLKPLGLRDLKPRRRAPEGTPVAQLGFFRHAVLIALINYFHYMRLLARVTAKTPRQT